MRRMPLLTLLIALIGGAAAFVVVHGPGVALVETAANDLSQRQSVSASVSGAHAVYGGDAEQNACRGIHDLMRSVRLQRRQTVALFEQLQERIEALESAGAKGHETDDSSLSAHGNGTPRDELTADADLGKWLRDELEGGRWDRDSTNLAAAQVESTLVDLPGVELDEIACNVDYCQAVFASVDGERPRVGELFGRPPFSNEGFTMEGTDGRVHVFFTMREVSLDEIRERFSKEG